MSPLLSLRFRCVEAYNDGVMITRNGSVNNHVTYVETVDKAFRVSGIGPPDSVRVSESMEGFQAARSRTLRRASPSSGPAAAFDLAKNLRPMPEPKYSALHAELSSVELTVEGVLACARLFGPLGWRRFFETRTSPGSDESAGLVEVEAAAGTTTSWCSRRARAQKKEHCNRTLL